eukprot:TRINITY_DN82752_c0_g1_i1.p1 TRINITY_DN82752_c0_g1~~TRINITY_DN82752_c0_g1_i1.p1  ORF type:complete len:788 (+),score=188.39 TRINITY_DN82752_c0_g1_i1:77-2365(+)
MAPDRGEAVDGAPAAAGESSSDESMPPLVPAGVPDNSLEEERLPDACGDAESSDASSMPDLEPMDEVDLDSAAALSGEKAADAPPPAEENQSKARDYYPTGGIPVTEPQRQRRSGYQRWAAASSASPPGSIPVDAPAPKGSGYVVGSHHIHGFGAGSVGDPEEHTGAGRSAQAVSMCQPCSDELAEGEYGYPKWPEEMRDPDFFKEELRKMRTDPRHNPNLLRDPNDQEFWNETQRFPWAKVLLRREQHWTDRRNVWLEQYKEVEKLNDSRGTVADLLEDCTPATKRLVAPILKYKVTEMLLRNVNEKSKQLDVPFRELMEDSGTASQLETLRKRLDSGGEAEAKRIQDDLEEMVNRWKEEERAKKALEDKERERQLMDMEGLKQALQAAEKAKKDGLVEWERGNWEEAYASWQQGDEALKRFRAPERCVEENKLIFRLHNLLLGNLAQAALKLERWHKALETVDRALAIKDDDHTTWFRKASACQHLGRLEDASRALDRVEEIAVGRPDRYRIVATTARRRTRLEAIERRHATEQRRMFVRSLQKGVFADARDGAIGAAEPTSNPAVAAAGQKSLDEAASAGTQLKADAQPRWRAAAAKPAMVRRGLKPGEFGGGKENLKVDEQAKALGTPQPQPATQATEGRVQLTRDGARNLLTELEKAYLDPWFRQRVDKLSVDVRFDPREFVRHLRGVTLEVQKPVLGRWGFDASQAGVRQMTIALQEHTRGAGADPELRARAEEVGRLPYGTPELQMYERVQSLAE